jgi:hypothetical protein
LPNSFGPPVYCVRIYIYIYIYIYGRVKLSRYPPCSGGPLTNLMCFLAQEIGIHVSCASVPLSARTSISNIGLLTFVYQVKFTTVDHPRYAIIFMWEANTYFFHTNWKRSEGLFTVVHVAVGRGILLSETWLWNVVPHLTQGRPPYGRSRMGSCHQEFLNGLTMLKAPGSETLDYSNTQWSHAHGTSNTRSVISAISLASSWAAMAS